MAAPDAKTLEISAVELIDAQLTEWMRKVRVAEAAGDAGCAAAARARIDDLLDVRNGG